MKYLILVLLAIYITLVTTESSIPIQNEINGSDDLGTKTPTVEKAPTTCNCVYTKSLTTEIRKKYDLNDQKYENYLEAYGILITSFGKMQLAFLRVACYIVKFMLSDNEKIRNLMFTRKVRFVLLGYYATHENVPGIVINRDFDENGVYYGKIHSPMVVFSKQYLNCSRNPKKQFMQVVAHSMLKYAIPVVFPEFMTTLKEDYHRMKSFRALRSKYGGYSESEYYTEGVLSYFNQISVIRLGPREPYTFTNTREFLEYNFPFLYRLIRDVHACKNNYKFNPCKPTTIQSIQNVERVNCVYKPPCLDDHQDCSFYADMGQCNNFQHICPLSCGLCE